MHLRISNCFLALALAVIPAWAFSDVPPIIDTHTHLENTGGFFKKPAVGAFGVAAPGQNFHKEVEAAIRRMDRYGIRRIVLLPPPMGAGAKNIYEIDEIRFAAEQYPDRISLGGGGGSLNGMIQSTPADGVTDEMKQQFRAKAEKIAAAGAVVFGEVAAHHLSLRRMGPNHAYEYVPPDHPLLLLLADIAAEKGIPIDLHLDLVPNDMDLPDRPIFNPTTPSHLKANLAGFERLLDHNKKAKIIWAHAGTDPLGTRQPQIQRDLLTRHPNLYMSIRLGVGAPPPFIALDQNLNLKPQWLALFRDFPDRFVLGSDFFHAAGDDSARGPEEEGLNNFKIFLQQLPPDLAEAIAHGNAEKLYRFSH